MNPLLVAIVAVGVLVTLPITMPIAAAQQLIADKRKAKRALTFVCVECKKILGAESLERADQSWAEYMSARMRDGVRIRVIRKVRAICDCGQKYNYDEKNDIFEVVVDA